MMFLEVAPDRTLAIGQPAHAWLAGRLLREWRETLDPQLLLAAEQHDGAWTDWERQPTFDPASRRPKRFLDVGAAEHAPLWSLSVDRALAAWGRHAALLISRHGCVIYASAARTHLSPGADQAAADRYVAEQAPKQARWARSLGLDETALTRQSGLIRLADQLSLFLCGGFPVPPTVSGPAVEGGSIEYHLTPLSPGAIGLDPWPFRPPGITVAIDAVPLPPAGLPDEAAMRAWHAATLPETLSVRLEPSR